LGEIYDSKKDQYYSQKSRFKYYPPDNVNKNHAAPGHFLGYRWAIQRYTQEGDLVFDPTVGTGTAIIEAINFNRKGVGIELEYPDIAKVNIKYQIEKFKAPGKPILIQGDALNMERLLAKHRIHKNSVSLILNGTLYPILKGKVSSDTHEKFFSGTNLDRIRTIEYANEKNLGTYKGEKYWNLIDKLYSNCIPYLKKGGRLIILIKDPMLNKKPYPLHVMLSETILKNKELKYDGCFLHKHIPMTLAMSTYLKRHPGVQIPLYQTGLIFKKS